MKKLQIFVYGILILGIVSSFKPTKTPDYHGGFYTFYTANNSHTENRINVKQRMVSEIIYIPKFYYSGGTSECMYKGYGVGNSDFSVAAEHIFFLMIKEKFGFKGTRNDVGGGDSVEYKTREMAQQASAKWAAGWENVNYKVTTIPFKFTCEDFNEAVKNKTYKYID